MSDISASSKVGEQIISEVEVEVEVVKYLYIFVLHLQLQQR